MSTSPANVPLPQRTAETGRAPHAQRLERIAVFRALRLGDLLCAVPALRALRAAFRGARMTLIGLPDAAGFARRFRRYIDDFIAFPGAPGLPERAPSAAEVAAFDRRVYAERFDLALQLHGNGRVSNSIAGAFAHECAGFYAPDAPCPDPACFLPYPEEEPEVRRLLRLLEFIGVPLQGEWLEFPVTREEWRAAAALRARYGLRPGHYACIHPGARAAARRWRAAGFARTADYVASRGLHVVLTGTADEADLTAAVARSMLAPCLNLAGHAVMGVLAAMLTGARVLVCNDTGVSHMAAALGVPSVVVFTGSSPARWAPLDSRRHRPVFHAVDCRPCEHAVCPIGHPCATGVLPGDVIREVEGLLS